MRVSGGLPYYNTSLNSSDFPVAFIYTKSPYPFVERPLCVKGAVSEADWGIVKKDVVTIPPSRIARHLPLHKGGLPTQFLKS